MSGKKEKGKKWIRKNLKVSRKKVDTINQVRHN